MLIGRVAIIALISVALCAGVLSAYFVLGWAQTQSQRTYFVRADGGSSSQCDGLTDAAYPGSGAARPCAWDHPFRAFPPGAAPRIAGGDTLIIGQGSYKMGYGAPETNTDVCSGVWDCYMSAVPSGLDASRPTHILGRGWSDGCGSSPQLWGTERAEMVFNLAGSSYVSVACVEITDHSGCAEDHAAGTTTGRSSYTCERDSSPYGPWAAIGLYAQDSTNVSLSDVNIHGMARAGIHAARLADWTLNNVRIVGNGLTGWDGDIVDGDSNSGTMTFRRLVVEWNGCPESYPGLAPRACWAQQAGGYGDGFGTGTTGGRWVFEDSAFKHNTSDGLDLLYATLPTSTIEIRRTIAEGNAGNQLKVSGPTEIENTIMVGNCGFFVGQTYMVEGDHCRAGGDALTLSLRPGNRVTVTNSTITSEGVALSIAECVPGLTCDGSEAVTFRNSILLGQARLDDPGTPTTFAWYDDEPDNVLPSNPYAAVYSLITGTLFYGDAAPCPGETNLCDASPMLVSALVDTFDARLTPGSPAIDAGNSDACPADDFKSAARPLDGNGDGQAVCDLGAYEFSPLRWNISLPRILKNQ